MPDADLSVVNQVSGWFEEWAPIQHVDGPSGAWLVRKQWPEIIVQNAEDGVIAHRVALESVELTKTGTIWNTGAVAITAAGDVVCATHADRLGAYDVAEARWRWWVPFSDDAKYILATKFHCAVAVRADKVTRLRRFDLADGRDAGTSEEGVPDHYVDTVLHSAGDAFLAGARKRRVKSAGAPWIWHLGSAGSLEFDLRFEAVCVGFDGEGLLWAPPPSYPERRVEATVRRLGRDVEVGRAGCPAVPSKVGGAHVIGVGNAGGHWVTSKHRDDGAGLIAHTRGGTEVVLSNAPRQRAAWAAVSPSGWLMAGVAGDSLVLWRLDGSEAPRVIADVADLDVRGAPVFGYDDKWVGVVDGKGGLHPWSTGRGSVLPVVQLPDALDAGAHTRWRVFSGPKGLFATRRVEVRRTQKQWTYKPGALHMNSVEAPLTFTRLEVPASKVKHAAHAMSDDYAVLARPAGEHAAWAVTPGVTYLVIADHKGGVRVIDARTRKQMGRYKGTAWPGPGHRGLSISPDASAAAIALDGYVRGHGRKKQGVLILDLPKATLSRFVPFDYLNKYVEDTRWLDGRRTAVAWDATRHLGGDLFMRVGVMEGGREPSDVFAGSGQGSVVLGRDARAVYQHLDTGEVRVYRLDGTEVLTYALLDGGAYAYSPDGRRFCDGTGCNYFSCAVDGKSRVVSECAAALATSFDLAAELEAEPSRDAWRAK